MTSQTKLVVITSMTTAEATRPGVGQWVQVATTTDPPDKRNKPECQRRISSSFHVDGPILVGSTFKPIPDKPNFSRAPTGSTLSDSALTKSTEN